MNDEAGKRHGDKERETRSSFKTWGGGSAEPNADTSWLSKSVALPVAGFETASRRRSWQAGLLVLRF
jgi:hypothetical protein